LVDTSKPDVGLVVSNNMVTAHFRDRQKKQQKNPLISYQVNYAQPIPTPTQILRKMIGVTQKIITK
jgi:hypothetical protein